MATGTDTPFSLISSVCFQVKQDFAGFAQCGMANTIAASGSHVVCPNLFHAFSSRWRWDEDIIYQKDMILTLFSDLDKSCEEQSSLSSHQ